MVKTNQDLVLEQMLLDIFITTEHNQCVNIYYI